jgi:hypothetical protein
MEQKLKITKELIESVLNDITPKNKDRQFKAWVMFNNEEEAEAWLRMFNNLLKEEANKTIFKNETEDNS